MSSHPFLMIPGPVPISTPVFEATCTRPRSHLDPVVKHALSRALRAMRTVWGAGPDHQPFVVAGGGTLAMESAASNLVDPGHTVLVVNTGTFGDRMAEMLRRRGANVLQIGAELGSSYFFDIDDHPPGIDEAKVLTRAIHFRDNVGHSNSKHFNHFGAHQYHTMAGMGVFTNRLDGSHQREGFSGTGVLMMTHNHFWKCMG